jgi:hypothetical protein
MRVMVSGRPWALGALIAVAALALTQLGAGPTKKKKEGKPPKVEETVGDLSFVVSKSEMKVEGVGLVVGLDSTGGDPPPSWYRKQLVDEMSKAGVEKADKLLASPHWDRSPRSSGCSGRGPSRMPHQEPGWRVFDLDQTA